MNNDRRHGTGSLVLLVTCRLENLIPQVARRRWGFGGVWYPGLVPCKWLAIPATFAHEERTGRVAEWFKAPVLKTGVPARVPWVQNPTPSATSALSGPETWVTERP